MVEIHAWITLRYDDYDSEDQYQKQFVSRFKQYLQNDFNWLLTSSHCQLVSYNGLECFTIHGQHNHKDENFYPLEIFEWVAKEGKGSYGMLYLFDDEDRQNNNKFQVYILKRGKLIQETDSFLSPYFPEVEKKYDKLNPSKD